MRPRSFRLGSADAALDVTLPRSRLPVSIASFTEKSVTIASKLRPPDPVREAMPARAVGVCDPPRARLTCSTGRPVCASMRRARRPVHEHSC
eukprot:2932675-Prymnesium_polylepis.3